MVGPWVLFPLSLVGNKNSVIRNPTLWHCFGADPKSFMNDFQLVGVVAITVWWMVGEATGFRRSLISVEHHDKPLDLIYGDWEKR